MKQAAERGVEIDVLWGQEEYVGRDRRPKGQPTAAEIVQIVKNMPEVYRHRDSLRFHEQSTRSHAKMIVFDPEESGEYVTLIGSCNWLASGYTSIEASVCLRSTAIVREVLRCLARAVHAGSGSRSRMTETLLDIATRLPDQNSRRASNARAALIIDDAHNDCMLRVRDEARERILLVSHRMGPVARPGALVPLAVACSKGTVEAKVFYGKLEVDKPLLSQWQDDAARHGVVLKAIRNPRVHAKLLAWDDDAVVVSSQNWLSADPGESHMVRELGVMIDAPGVGASAIKLFDSQIGVDDT
jgi:hypothetical protein